MVFIAQMTSNAKVRIEANSMVVTSERVIVLYGEDGIAAAFQPEQVKYVVAESALLSEK